MDAVILRKRLEEFENNIWDHTKDPFQISFDEPSSIDMPIVEAMVHLSNLFNKQVDENIIIEQIKLDIENVGIKYLEKLLQFSGLTRNKIITDLRASASSGSISVKIPSSYARLPRSLAWPFAGIYIIKRIKPILSVIYSLPNPKKFLDSINSATWPGWIRQERAKRSGHEAEGRIARIFENIGIPFEPIEKADNPLGGDVKLNEVSFDLIVPNALEPHICIKATVHTANIGQYGESKDHLEIEEAKRMLDEYFSHEQKPVLLAFLNGVGFRSNRAGLEGILMKADEFVQFRTLWKAIIIANYRVGGIHELKLFLPENVLNNYIDFFKKYNWDSSRLLSEIPTINTIEAGDGIFTFNKARTLDSYPSPPKKGAHRQVKLVAD